MAIAAASSFSLGPSRCHFCQIEGAYFSPLLGVNNVWIKHTLDGCKTTDLPGIRCRDPFFGSTQFHWLSVGRNLSLSKVLVAADYSDSVPNSSSYGSNQGYHPLEEIKVCKRIQETKLSSAEIARTTVEANSNALLVFPGTVHSEPHEQISWAEFRYVVDDYGDIFFEILDDENILKDRGASNLVNVLIGMDIPVRDNNQATGDFNFSDVGTDDEFIFDDEYFEVMDSEISEAPVYWGMPDSANTIWVHPIYFAKCLMKAVHVEHDKKMDHPSNGVSIVGCLRPAFVDEESYLRRLFHFEDDEGYASDGKDGEAPTSSSKYGGCKSGSTLYRLEMMRIELFSIYGVQSLISLEDFQDAECDVLVHSTSAILERFSEKGIQCNVALKALCKKKGLQIESLQIEGANLIGVDSLGIDVRVFSGVEVQTRRFPFKIRAMSEAAAEKQIRQLLFPRSRRKKFQSHGDELRDPDFFCKIRLSTLYFHRWKAKNQKKLFVVYISGEDSDVENVEDSTWTDLKVKESLSKYCILLHIRGGSTDAANFSAIYPQKSFPCITAIGYNGVQVWRSEGFVSAEVLASSLEKAWLSLHIQETTAAVLSAALASKKYESSSSGASTVSQSEQGSSSSASVPLTTMANVDLNLEANIAVTSGVIEENRDSENTVQEKNPELVEKSSSESFSADNLANIVDEQCGITNEDTRTVVSSVTSSPAGYTSENVSSHPEDDCLIPVKDIDHRSSCPSGSSPVSAAEAEKAMQHVKDKGIDDALENTATANIPTDVHLNIRLPDSSSLQERFPVTYTLSMIKDYVDRNQSSGMSSYDLAIPYPRKIFGDQDLSKSLLDLGLLNRQALIVVPHRRTTGFQGQRSSDYNRNLTATEASPGSNGGYFAYVRSLLSYVNPFSYLGGGASSSTTGQESQSGIWEYSPNPTLQNNLSGRNRSTSTASDDSRNRRPVTTRYGSNIHTLKRDEDDDRFSDRNPFWNGNSTQYGGSSDSK
ncbi:hypothetical protein V6N13_142618 [Hibiscus sabdariffa]